jgi:Winged helix-turn-helix domain (DUF2582)
MASQALSPINGGSRDNESLDRLLRRASAYSTIERFKRQSPEGAFTVSYHQIGETSGMIWEILATRGPLTFADLMELIDAPQSLFFMAIGWLAREQKLRLEPADGDCLISLA